MPELPDVEIQKRYVDATSLHQQIDSVEVQDSIVLDGLSPQTLGKALANRTFESTRRHGKHLFIELDSDNWLGLHFGMTGKLKYYKNADEKPEFEQVLFHFKNGYQLAYVMPRKLGQIRLLEKVDSFLEEKELGPDALDLDFETFRHLLSGKRGMIKSALMNQSILAGVGNVYSDEILFQVQIYPRTKLNDLSENQFQMIFDTMQNVLETAIERDANPEGFPGSYLTPHRSEGEQCPHCGGEIRRIKVSGRAGYYCPQCQTK